MRITQVDRLLLALQGSPEHWSAYEYPLAYSQIGLCARLGMKQSQLSRESRKLTHSGHAEVERRRIQGEARRKNGYRLTEVGLAHLDSLLETILAQKVWLMGEAGLPEQHPLKEVLRRWGAVDHEALALFETLRSAPQHEGLPFLEQETLLRRSTTSLAPDMASELIDALQQLAKMKRDLGEVVAASENLLKAAQLHRKRGFASGELTCLLAASTISGDYEHDRVLELARDIEVEQLESGWWKTLADLLPTNLKGEWLMKIWQSKPGEEMAKHVAVELRKIGIKTEEY
jgi:DNA-binding MarR family transcriptional regulator